MKCLSSPSQSKAVSNRPVVAALPGSYLGTPTRSLAAALQLHNLFSNFSTWNHAQLCFLLLKHLNAKAKLGCQPAT